MLETVSKSVTERKESTKQVTDQATGVERRRDSHIESSTTEEVRSKRQEETVESYDSGPLPTAAQTSPAASQPTLSSRPPGSAGVASVPDVAETSPRKTPSKHPVAIRVQDEHESDETNTASEGLPVPPPLQAGYITGGSILRTASSEDVERKHPHKLEFQEEPEKEEPEYQRAPLVKPPADLALRAAASSDKPDDEEEEVAEPPPSRFNLRRKDSIAVAKLRLLRQAEGGSSEEEPEEDQPEPQSPGSPDKKHPVFRPPIVISIVSEQAEEVSEPTESTGPKDASGAGAQPLTNFASTLVAPGGQQTVTESSTHVDKQVTSSEKEEVKTYANEIVTNKNTDEVVKQTKSEVINESSQAPSTAIVPREPSAATIVATVVDDVSANVKTPMDDRSKHSL